MKLCLIAFLILVLFWLYVVAKGNKPKVEPKSKVSIDYAGAVKAFVWIEGGNQGIFEKGYMYPKEIDEPAWHIIADGESYLTITDPEKTYHLYEKDGKTILSNVTDNTILQTWDKD